MWYGASPTGAAIQVQGMKRGHQISEDRLTRNITLLGNRFVNPPGSALFVGSAVDIDFVDNKVIIEHDLPRNTAAVLLRNVEGVRVERLLIKNEAANLEEVISIDAKTAPDERGVYWDSIEISGSQEVPLVKDDRS